MLCGATTQHGGDSVILAGDAGVTLVGFNAAQLSAEMISVVTPAPAKRKVKTSQGL